MSLQDFQKLQEDAMQAVKDFVKKTPLSAITIEKKGQGWEVSVEVEERKAIPDTQTLIGIYRVTFDAQKKITGYKRVQTRKRGDSRTEEEEE
ncbi:gas vesicle protein [Candidatus Woesearchaeota archaeon]|nr:gas vesicle protein [Candidatus Woesearchaeota archaeon]